MDEIIKFTLSQLLNVSLTDEGIHLTMALLSAHYSASSANNNMSKLAYVNSIIGSGNPVMAIIGGLSTLGLAHGPVTKARECIYKYDTIDLLIESNHKVPGYGGAFFKDKLDPSFEYVASLIQSTEKYKILQDGADKVNRSKGRIAVYPNPAGITACVAELLGLPEYMENWFFISGRVPQWFVTKAK